MDNYTLQEPGSCVTSLAGAGINSCNFGGRGDDKWVYISYS